MYFSDVVLKVITIYHNDVHDKSYCNNRLLLNELEVEYVFKY